MMENNLHYKAGDVVTMKVSRVSEMGAFLDAGTGNTSDDILLHKLQQLTPVKAGDEVRVYLYLDPHRRLTASMKLPKMKEGQLGYAKVINVTKDGGFVDIGGERGVFLPYTEMLGRVNPNQKIWIKLYRDKSGRPAVTMKVDKDLAPGRRNLSVKMPKWETLLQGPFIILPKTASSFSPTTGTSRYCTGAKRTRNGILLMGNRSRPASRSSGKTGMWMYPCVSRKKPLWWMMRK